MERVLWEFVTILSIAAKIFLAGIVENMYIVSIEA